MCQYMMARLGVCSDECNERVLQILVDGGILERAVWVRGRFPIAVAQYELRVKCSNEITANRQGSAIECLGGSGHARVGRGCRWAVCVTLGERGKM